MSKATRRGHPDQFTEAQNTALREVLRKLEVPSQRALGEILGVSQQSAGRLMNDDEAGFSYASGTRLVRHLGYSGVDEFFAKKRIALPGPSSQPEAKAS